MTRWLIPIIIVALGSFIVIAGALYAVFAFGVPSPHPTPAVAAKEARVLHQAELAMMVGLVVILIGCSDMATVIYKRLFLTPPLTVDAKS